MPTTTTPPNQILPPFKSLRKFLGGLRFKISQHVAPFPYESSTSASSDDDYTHSHVAHILEVDPEQSTNGPLMLYIALQKKLFDPFEALLRMNANPNADIQNGTILTSAFQLAIDLDTPRYLVALLEYGGNIKKTVTYTENFRFQDDRHLNIENSVVRTFDLPPLCYCARYNRHQCAKVLLEFGADVSASDSLDRNPIYFAGKYGHTETLKILIQHCTKTKQLSLLNTHSKQAGQTSLIWASFFSHTDCATLLLEAGADPNICENDGTSPLIWASHQGNDILVQQLIKHGADVHHVERDGYSPLYSACRKWSTTTIQLLLDAGADPNTVSKEGWSAAHAACGEKKPSNLTLLVSVPHTNLNLCTIQHHGRFDSNLTPLDISMQSGAFGCVDKILSYL